MPKRIAFVEAEINRHLAAAVAADSPNRLTAAEVREWARCYLATIDRDEELDPLDTHLPHWDLLLHDPADDALFVVLVFRAECLELYCGSGSRFHIRDLADRYSSYPPDEFLPSMRDAFGFDVLRIERDAAALWLGRGWKP